ncbi:MAG: hypothetical protein ABJD11_02480 [Gemmatimonadota bacterium]
MRALRHFLGIVLAAGVCLLLSPGTATDRPGTTLDIDPVAVAEATAWGMTLIGGGMLVVAVRRRRRVTSDRRAEAALLAGKGAAEAAIARRMHLSQDAIRGLLTTPSARRPATDAGRNFRMRKAAAVSPVLAASLPPRRSRYSVMA